VTAGTWLTRREPKLLAVSTDSLARAKRSSAPTSEKETWVTDVKRLGARRRVRRQVRPPSVVMYIDARMSCSVPASDSAQPRRGFAK
jgi:hypothetical protein